MEQRTQTPLVEGQCRRQSSRSHSLAESYVCGPQVSMLLHASLSAPQSRYRRPQLVGTIDKAGPAYVEYNHARRVRSTGRAQRRRSPTRGQCDARRRVGGMASHPGRRRTDGRTDGRTDNWCCSPCCDVLIFVIFFLQAVPPPRPSLHLHFRTNVSGWPRQLPCPATAISLDPF